MSHRTVLECDTSDPVTCLELSPINGAIAVGFASGAVRISVDTVSVTLCRRSEEAICAIYLSHSEVVAVVGDVCLKRWQLASLRADSPPVAGAVHDVHAFPFAHNYGQCASATCLMSGSKLIVSRGGFDRDVVRVNVDGAVPVSFDVLAQGPLHEVDCWPVAFDGERVAFLARKRLLSVWAEGEQARFAFLVEFDLGATASMGIAQLLRDRLVGILNGRLCVWTVGGPDSGRRVPGPHYHGWRRQMVHFCLNGSDPAHVTLATLGTDRSLCFFEGALDALQFKRRVDVGFARFHLDMPYFLRILSNDVVVFNDDGGVHIVDLC